jgi:uncharacterized protein YcfJ
MKRLTVLAGLISTGLAATAGANPYEAGAQYGSPQFTDVAQVISSTPILERVATPRRVCNIEQVAVVDRHHGYHRGHDNRRYQDQRVVDDGRYQPGGVGAGTVLGAVIGGAIGRQFGNSSGGRDRGTAVGAVLGGVIGNDMERNSRNDNYRYASNGYGRDYVEVQRAPEVRNVERCSTVTDYRDEVRGYDVRYRYHGRDYTTRLSYQPGPTIPVSVDVRPNAQPSYQRGY